MAYGVGFVVSTGLLHLLGITIGTMMRCRGRAFDSRHRRRDCRGGLFFLLRSSAASHE